MEDILAKMDDPEEYNSGMQANGGSAIECDTSAPTSASVIGIDLRSIINPCESHVFITTYIFTGVLHVDNLLFEGRLIYTNFEPRWAGMKYP